MRMERTIWIQAFSVALFVGIGALIGAATGPGMEWYRDLDMPSLTPPDAAFPIVWTALYVLLGLAFGRMIASGFWRDHSVIFAVFCVQMAMNWAWSFLFFTFHMLLVSWLWIAVMIGLSLWLLVAFFRVDRVNFWLMLPYVAWIGYASILAWQIWTQNPTGT